MQQLSQVHNCGDQTTAWPCGRKRPGWCPRRRWNLWSGTEYQVLHRSLVLTRPKTKAGKRIMPLIAPLADMLRAQCVATASWPNPHNLVGCHRDGRPLDPVRDRNKSHELMSAVGVPPAPEGNTNGMHRAPHTTATLLLHYGVDRYVIASTIGHSKASTTELYQKVGLHLKREGFEHLAELVAAGSTPER